MIWGTPIIAKKHIFVPTGQMYDVPASVLACANATIPSNYSSCLDKKILFDSIVKIDTETGLIVASAKTVDIDAWNVDCFLGRIQCPKPIPNSDYDASGVVYSKDQDLIFAYNKAGAVFIFDFDLNEQHKIIFNNTGSISGGFIGSAALRDHKDRNKMRLVLANTNGNYNAWVLPNGTTIYSGGWITLDGYLNVKWVTPVPGVGLTPQTLGKVPGDIAYGGMTITNDLVFAFSRNGGVLTFMNLELGNIVWEIPTGSSQSGSCTPWGNAIICPTGPGGNPFAGGPTTPGPVNVATSPQRTLINAWYLLKWEL